MKKDNRRRNYLILARLLVLGTLSLLWARRNKIGPEKETYGTIAMVLTIALTIVTILFYVWPGVFGPKPSDLEEKN